MGSRSIFKVGDFDIKVGDLANPQTRDLLAYHLEQMHRNSPEGSVFALDLSGLNDPLLSLWGGWAGDEIAGVGALKSLPDKGGEIKSMRTHPDFLRQGVASVLLDHIIGQAVKSGMHRLSLETGSGDAFEAALALYRRRGFGNGAAFSDYEASAFNQFLHLELGSER